MSGICIVLMWSAQVVGQRIALVWSDEFNTDGTPSPSNWSYDLGRGQNGWGNGELQYYTAAASNVRVMGGFLHITALRQTVGDARYTSARIKSQYLADFTYGRIEARAKLPIGAGMWPAIWMMPTQSVFGGWPRSGEIDIMEGRGNEPTRVEGTVHYWRAGCTSTNVLTCREFRGNHHTLPNGRFSDDFNIFAIEWTPEGIDWFVNGTLYHSIRKSTLNAQWYPFDESFHLILNLAVGGNFFGANANVVDESLLPQSLVIDYIRVYQDVNQAPTVSLDLPGGVRNLASGEPVRLEAAARDTDGTVRQVDFFLDGTALGSVMEAPFHLDLGPISDGCHRFTAVAIDNDNGVSTSSEPMDLVVGAGCTRAPFREGGHPLPGLVPLVEFDKGGQGLGYHDTTPLVNLGRPTDPKARPHDGVDVVTWVVADTTRYLIAHTERDEWMEYTIHAENEGSYFIDLRGVGTSSRGTATLFLNDTFLITMALTAQSDTTIVTRSTVNPLTIPAGTHRLRVVINTAGIRLESLRFRLASTDIPRDVERPGGIELHPNHPNPFNPGTQIRYTLDSGRPIRLVVQDLLGRELAVLADGVKPAGTHQVWFDATGLASGVYIVRLETATSTLVRRILLVK